MRIRDPHQKNDILVNIQMATDCLFGMGFILAFGGSIIMGIVGFSLSAAFRELFIPPPPRRSR